MTQPGSPRATLVAAGAVALFAFGWFAAMGGLNVLAPTNLAWMLAGDWHGHLFGWLFTRNGPWTLPLGLAPDLMAPYGSSAAFTDAIPIAAVTTRLLAPVEPVALQFFGAWMCLCVIAQGLVGFSLARLRVGDAATAALAGMIFATDPVMTGRYGHPPFFAQFLVLALVGVALVPASSVHGARRLAAAALALDFFGCGVNAYLGMICSALTFAVMVRLCLVERHFSRAEGAAWFLGAPATTTFSFWLFGFLAGVKGPVSQLGAEGFGQFSSDLTTFFNPMGWSRFMPNLMTGPRQGEGYAYLGAGVLALLLLRAALGARQLLGGQRPTGADWKRVGPVLAMALVLMVYALSNHVTFAGRQVLDLGDLYAKLGSLTNVFRSSGRFSWPLHALLTLAAVVGVAALGLKPWATRAVLAAALVLQVADLDVGRSAFHGPFKPFNPLPHPAWSRASEGYKHLVIHPVMAQWVCPYDEPLVILMSWVAYTNHLSINSGLVGRNPPDTPSRCMRHVSPSELDAESIYVVHYPEFAADLLDAGYACGSVDSRVVCVLDGKDTPLRRAVEERRLALPPPAAR